MSGRENTILIIRNYIHFPNKDKNYMAGGFECYIKRFNVDIEDSY